jgi:ATP-dependent DNA ligase
MRVEQGYEGAMLKDPNGTYQYGQRSSFWNKVKMFDDAEFLVIGYELGQRGVQDLIFVCKHGPHTFNAQMNGSLASKQVLYDKIDTLIGKRLTVKYFGLSKYGVPNLPKGKCFRDE